MKHHQITVHPGPCGANRCCGCYCQMFLPCTAPCTLCVIYREAKLGDGRVASPQASLGLAAPTEACSMDLAPTQACPVVEAPTQPSPVHVDTTEACPVVVAVTEANDVKVDTTQDSPLHNA